MIKYLLNTSHCRVWKQLAFLAAFASVSSSCDENGDFEKTRFIKEVQTKTETGGDDEKFLASSVKAHNSALGEFTLNIQSSLQGENILWKNEPTPTECDDVSRVDGAGSDLKLTNIDPSREVIYICLYNKATGKPLTDTTLKIDLVHDISFQSSFSGTGPLSSVHSFSIDSAGLTFAAALKGRTLEIYKTEEKLVGSTNTPDMILSNRIVLDKYYKKSVKYGDHLILFTAEEVDIIENFITSEDYNPVNLIKSELLLGDVHISGTNLVAVTAKYGINVYDLSDLDKVTLTHDKPLARDINQSVLKGNYLYTSNYDGIVVYSVSDLNNIEVVGILTLASLFPNGDVRPVKFAVDTYDDSTVVFTYNKKSQAFISLYIDTNQALAYSVSTIEPLYPNSSPGIMGITVLPNDELFIETTNKLSNGTAKRRMNYRAVTVSTVEGELSTIGASLNYVEKTNDLSITKCASIMFGDNPYPVCSHLGPTFSTINVNTLPSGNAGYEKIVSSSVGAASYIDLYEDSGENVTYKAMYNHQVNTLGVYKSSSVSKASEEDEVYHSSYRDSSFTIDGFGYGRSKDELIVYTPYNSPNKFHLVRLTSPSTAEYIGITAEQTCNDRDFELTGGKDIYISGDEVLAADGKSVYHYELNGNGTSTPYDDFYSCRGYFELASNVEATYNKTNNVVFKVNGGLYVFDKKSLSAGPQLIPLLSDVNDLAIANDLLYIKDTLSYSAIKVFDISNPSAPEFLFSDASYVQINSMITSGDHLFVHDIGTMKISVNRISNDKRAMNRYSSQRIPVENFFDYSELDPVATNKEIIFPMYDYGYVKYFPNE